MDEANAKIAVLEAKLGSTTADLEDARPKIVVLTDEGGKGIDACMLKPDFVELMREHDAQRWPRKAGTLLWKPSWRLTPKHS